MGAHNKPKKKKHPNDSQQNGWKRSVWSPRRSPRKAMRQSLFFRGKEERLFTVPHQAKVQVSGGGTWGLRFGVEKAQ